MVVSVGVSPTALLPYAKGRTVALIQPQGGDIQFLLGSAPAMTHGILLEDGDVFTYGPGNASLGITAISNGSSAVDVVVTER